MPLGPEPGVREHQKVWFELQVLIPQLQRLSILDDDAQAHIGSTVDSGFVHKLIEVTMSESVLLRHADWKTFRPENNAAYEAGIRLGRLAHALFALCPTAAFEPEGRDLRRDRAGNRP